MDTTKVAIIGLGTVGSGLAKILIEQPDLVARRSGKRIELVCAVVRDLQKRRLCEIPQELLTTDLNRVLQDPSIRVVAQLIGGVDDARRIMLRLLESGKDVVTANKALLAEHGPELFKRARELDRTIAFEAAVAGGIPIIANLGQCLSANRIESIRGILNGTSNFIISRMEDKGKDYYVALREAQDRGYAEANPAMDVDGSDAAQKLAILTQLAFGVHAPWREIPREGIESLRTIDLRCAKDFGYRIRLLAVAEIQPSGLELHVSPTLVRAGQQLAEVRGAFNAVNVHGHAVGDVFYYGLGAGQMPTASAVAADLIDIVVGRAALTFRTLNLWSSTAEPVVPFADHRKARSRYYLRFVVRDQPGVLAEISPILARQRISIASMIQHAAEVEGEAETPSSETLVNLVMMTHETTAGAIADAIQAIGNLAPVRREQCVSMRVAD